MSAKHTRGPWIYSVDPNNESYYLIGIDGNPEAVIDHQGGMIEADARLIAAAPELLEALEAIWPFVEEDDGGFATTAYQEAINDVRAAIKKARGES